MTKIANTATAGNPMPARLKIALGLLGIAILACLAYAILHEFCLVEARWLYR